MRICLFVLFSASVFSCSRNDNYRHTTQPLSGICISFDDRTVDEWFELRELYNRYNARLTFFVTRFDSLTPAQVEKLRILQSDGHEIGFHGALHVISEHYIQEHSMEEYLRNEIMNGIDMMNQKGFYPTSFSYPYSAKYTGTDEELLKYFYIVRSEVILKNPAEIMSSGAFFEHDGSRLVKSVSIDRNSPLTREQIEAGIVYAAHSKQVFLLYGHEPERTFDPKTLEYIFKLAGHHGLKYYRMSDLIK